MALLLCSACHRRDHANVPPAHRGIYHWKTRYNPSPWELQWLHDHKIDKLYIKLFDVEPGSRAGHPDWKMVPTATTTFAQHLPTDMEVVPVVYITVDAIRALEYDRNNDYTDLYARLIVKRIDEMMAEHYGDTIREVQLDCDWTQQTQRGYFALAKAIKGLLHKRGITLSGTLRLHQLHLVEELRVSKYEWMEPDTIPFDRKLLMCYNTGRLQDIATHNSILDFDNVGPYLKQYHLPTLYGTDVAWPVFGWALEFDSEGHFRRIINSHHMPDTTLPNLREEWGEPDAIRRTGRALPRLDNNHTTILFHLDSLNLSKYSHEDIEAFYAL